MQKDLRAKMIHISAKMIDLSAKIVDFSAKMIDFSAKMIDFSPKLIDFNAKLIDKNQISGSIQFGISRDMQDKPRHVQDKPAHVRISRGTFPKKPNKNVRKWYTFSCEDEEKDDRLQCEDDTF